MTGEDTKDVTMRPKSWSGDDLAVAVSLAVAFGMMLGALIAR